MDGPTASQQINRRDNKFDNSGANRSYDIKIEDFDIAFGDRWAYKNLSNLNNAFFGTFGIHVWEVLNMNIQC